MKFGIGGSQRDGLAEGVEGLRVEIGVDLSQEKQDADAAFVEV